MATLFGRHVAGNSGAPLLNLRGQVIGLVIGKSAGENLNYALPIEHVMAAGNRCDRRHALSVRVECCADIFTANYQ